MHNNTRKPVGLLGASGYAGRELLRILRGHDGVEVSFATSESEPRIDGIATVPLGDSDRWWGDTEVVFSCLPHGVSAPTVDLIRNRGTRVVDLSADFRMQDDVVYGLTEMVRPTVSTAELVANPGCYPTGAILGILPIAAAQLLDTSRPIVVNAASGVTGAGRSPKRELLFAEVAEDFKAYGVGNQHRHLPEMKRRLHPFTGEVDLIFTPHMIPVQRGILTTIQVPVIAEMDRATIETVFEEMYAGEPCIQVFSGSIPSLRDVVHRNRLAVGVVPTEHVQAPTVTVVTAIDNLLKGAAGQAVQNSNLMMGYSETRGLVC
jgi:N-acetyl-gamma-glutamyl-phosphate reductase